MVVAKLDLVVVVAALAGGLLWIEHANRIKIEMPAEIAPQAARAAACPENESVPFSADCMLFIQGGVRSDVRRPFNEADSASVESPEQP